MNIKTFILLGALLSVSVHAMEKKEEQSSSPSLHCPIIPDQPGYVPSFYREVVRKKRKNQPALKPVSNKVRRVLFPEYSG